MKHIIAALLLYILGSFTTAQAITPAGTIITNYVEASYIDPDSGRSLTSLSNEISITIRPVASVLLEQDLQQIVVPGETLYLTHTLSNFGNVPDSYTLKLENLTSDTDLQELQLYHDLNSNGVLDKDEPEITTTNELAIDSSLPLVIKCVIAETATDGLKIQIKLSALSQNNAAGTKSVSNIDTLTISGGDASQQQTEIRFLTPTRTALQNDGAPDFYSNEDFIDAQQYPLDTNTQGSNYHGFLIKI